MNVQGWLSNLLAVTAAVLAPLALIAANVAYDLGGVVVTVAAIVWMGFALILLTPLLE